ncbi:hypothetical protein TELCIR_22772, partial [Teladorsagia circumcincta]
VLCVGRVDSCRFVRSIGQLEYVVSDPSAGESVENKISILYTDEFYDVLRPTEKFSRGALVLIAGKLLRFKGHVAIQAYSIREILCQEEYECLQMEAFLALQYHTKNPSGQTPSRRPSASSDPRRSLPSVSPVTSVAVKRVASPAVVCSSTPKRPVASVRSSSTSSLVSGQSGGSSANIEKFGSKIATHAVSGENTSINETGSQDSFEDSVFLKTGN